MIISLSIFLVSILVVVWIFISGIDLVREYIHVNKNKNYIELQHYFCDVAYDIVYKDQILAFTANGYKVSGEHLDTTQKNFIKLVMQLMGTSNKYYLTKFYGDEQSLYTSCILWFKSKLDSDEIFKYIDDTKNKNPQMADKVLDETFFKAGE